MVKEFDTIAAIATAPGNASVGIIRISGENAFKIAEKTVKLKNVHFTVDRTFDHTVHYGFVYDGDELIYKGCLYDEAMEFSAITTVAGDRQIKGVRYYNLAGVESAEPQLGVNLKVTTWSDGSRTTEKIIK